MSKRTLHDNAGAPSLVDKGSNSSRGELDVRALLSTIWIAILIADLFRGVHEILRPGFVGELAQAGTVYGNEVTDGTLVWSGLVLAFLTSLVVLARVLPRRSNRRVNIVGAFLLAAGVLASWPKDPDDYVFGAFMVIGAGVVTAICARWRSDIGTYTEH